MANIAVEALLAIGVVVALISTLALLLMRDFFDKLHYMAVVATISGFCVLIAVVIKEGAGQAAIKMSLIVVVLAALVFSLRYFDSVGPHYNVLMLVFLGAMCGFSLTGDLFNLFVFFELMSAAAFALCGYKIEAPESLQGR